MSKITEFIKDRPSIKTFLDIYDSTNKLITINDASEEIGTLLALITYQKKRRPTVLVAPNLYRAQLIYDKLCTIIEDKDVLFFPQDEFVTSEMLVSSSEFRLERINTMVELSKNNSRIIVTHLPGILKPTVAPNKWIKAKFSLFIDMEISIGLLSKRLIEIGYRREYTVEKMGDYSVRGGIVDIFPFRNKQPIRLDFFGDFIESIRIFNIETQRSVARVDSINILPMTDFLFDENDFLKLRTKIEKIIQFGETSRETTDIILNDLANLSARRDLSRLCRYLPMMTDKHYTVLDYMDNPAVFFIDRKRVDIQYGLMFEDIASWKNKNRDYLGIDFSFIYLLEELNIDKEINIHYFDYKSQTKCSNAISIPALEPFKFGNNLNLFLAEMKQKNPELTVFITLKSHKARQQLSESLADNLIRHYLVGPKDDPLTGTINLIETEDYFDLYSPGMLVAVITDAAFEERKVPQKKGKYVSVFDNSKRLGSVSDLKHGDYIVHYDYGIGRFLDIVTMELGSTKNDYIHLEYYNGDKLYIPLESFSEIQKYSGSEGFIPRLSKLGGTDWERTKLRVKKRIRDIADKLIALYSERERAEGFSYLEYKELEADLRADFPYEETEDQVRAIEEIYQDMATPKPMDRLLCGDVGFGKTEVALRAAFRAVLNNKQVAYLAPTTVLSKQHYQTFSDRLGKFGVRVELLNRFSTKKQQRLILSGLREHSIDILIGTHRLLSEDVVFKDLGMLIVDEEQRFGVEHKEKIKEMKVSIDVLSLSATPIPRTMQMAIMGVKDMSLLESAPENRYPIQTYVLEQNDLIIKDAIERELARKGQVFYLYNLIDNIENIAFKLQRLVPDAVIRFAHGKMLKHELEDVIDKFVNQNIDVLVSTTIIETGIDIPNANTLIIHDADRLGLSQLYQIRGRVGRSDRIAYAYLMYKRQRQMTEDAEKRLKVIKEFTELGSGFKIAIRDLSIRGAGDLLGAEQSGFIDSVGIDLYLRILEEEIKEKQGQTSSKKEMMPIKATVSRYIDKNYISDDFVKIEMHKKISAVESISEIQDLLDEFKDRFGKYDLELEIYIYERLFEKLAARIGADKMLEKKNNITLILSEEASNKIAGDKLFRSGMRVSRFIRFAYKNNRLQIILDTVRLDRHWLYTMVGFLEQLTVESL